MKNLHITSAMHRPNFKRANKIADEVLRNMGYPTIPIPLKELVDLYGWKVEFDELHGPDGYTAKINRGEKKEYVIYIATDINIQKYSPITIQYRQRFTTAHEIGHILLHGHFNWHNVDESYEAILEVEAHWFASKLLMPDYIFTHINDLDPDLLAQKCNVNFTAAQKRIKNISDSVRKRLLFDVAQWARDDSLDPIKELHMSDEEKRDLDMFIESLSFNEVAVMNEYNEIECFVCGHAYWVGFSEIVPLQCVNCGADLFDLG